MSTGTGNIIPLQEAEQVRLELGLNPADAAREAGRRGVSVAAQTVRRWEEGGTAMNSAKLLGYLRVLGELKHERETGQAAEGSREPEDRAVTELINSIRALDTSLAHFIRNGMKDVSARDLQLLAGTADRAYRSFKSTSVLLAGVAGERSGK